MEKNLELQEMTVEEMKTFIKLGKKKEEMFQALQKGNGMKGILNVAYELLENPITVCDTSFSIIENYPLHSNDKDFQIRNGKQYMKTEAVQSMHRERLVERIFSETAPFTFYRDALGVNMMYCRISIKRSVVGYICVLARKRSFETTDFEIVRTLSQMLSVEMQKNSFFTERTGFKYEYFLTDLLDGNMVGKEFIEQRIRQLGRKPMRHYWIMTGMFEKEQDIYMNQRYYIEQMVTIIKNSIALFYKGHIVLLTSAEARIPFDVAEEVKIKDFLTLNRMKLAISHQFDNPSDAQLYYQQTIRLLSVCGSLETSACVLRYGEYMIESLIDPKMKKIQRKAAIHPDIKYLIAYDRENRTEYFHTLRVYISCGRNALRSAETLHIHKSTFFYRMNKIAELLGGPIEERLFQYEISLRLLKLSGDKSGNSNTTGK